MGYNKMEDTIQEAYKNVKLFNKIAGNLDNVTPESIDNQMSFVFEELTEGISAVERGLTPRNEWTTFDDENLEEYDPDVELLDAACDMFVTVAGLMQKLEATGFDVSGALKKVNENNLQKFPPIEYTITHNPEQGRVVAKAKHDTQPPNTTKYSDDRFGVWVFKDVATGKIKKPTNFVPVNLSGHEVAGFLSGGV